MPSRRSVPGNLASLDRLARAVENVVGDLERDAEQSPVLAVAAPEHARGSEELSRLQRAPLEVGVDGHVRIVLLLPLHRLPARKTECRLRE